jgi:hypothetical protein
MMLHLHQPVSVSTLEAKERQRALEIHIHGEIFRTAELRKATPF